MVLTMTVTHMNYARAGHKSKWFRIQRNCLITEDCNRALICKQIASFISMRTFAWCWVIAFDFASDPVTSMGVLSEWGPQDLPNRPYWFYFMERGRKQRTQWHKHGAGLLGVMHPLVWAATLNIARSHWVQQLYHVSQVTRYGGIADGDDKLHCIRSWYICITPEGTFPVYIKLRV